MLNIDKPIVTENGVPARIVDSLEESLGLPRVYISCEAFKPYIDKAIERRTVPRQLDNPKNDQQSLWVRREDGYCTGKNNGDGVWDDVPRIVNVALEHDMPFMHANGEQVTLKSYDPSSSIAPEPFYLTSATIRAMKQDREGRAYAEDDDNNGVWYNVDGSPHPSWSEFPPVYNNLSLPENFFEKATPMFGGVNLDEIKKITDKIAQDFNRSVSASSLQDYMFSQRMRKNLSPKEIAKSEMPSVADALDERELTLVHNNYGQRPCTFVYNRPRGSSVAQVTVTWLHPGEAYDKFLGAYYAIQRYDMGETIPIPVVMEDFAQQLRMMFNLNV